MNTQPDISDGSYSQARCALFRRAGDFLNSRGLRHNARIYRKGKEALARFPETEWEETVVILRRQNPEWFR
jgi:hypothetical protein